jgi:hypothetical protein
MAATSQGESLPRPLAALIEYFWLSASAKVAPALDADRRSLGERLTAVRARLDAALVLWSEAMGEPALEELARAEDLYRSLCDGPLAPVTVLAGGYAPPSQPAQRTISTFDARVRSLETALARVDGARLGPAARWLARGARLSAVGLVVALASLAVAQWRERAPMKTSASSSWGTQYFHDRAADRDFTTNWLLPDGMPGWIRVEFAPRAVRLVRLFNVRRLPSYGARRGELELFEGARRVGVYPLDLTASVGQMDPYVLRLPAPVRADALRVTVREFHGIGGGFAEIEVE